MPLPLLVAAACYMVDPVTNYCITGVSPHMIILPSPEGEKKQSAQDRHIDLQSELAKLKPTDPSCKPPYAESCP